MEEDECVGMGLLLHKLYLNVGNYEKEKGYVNGAFTKMKTCQTL
jgi:hypothetical protein